jgi:hypothetical protein
MLHEMPEILSANDSSIQGMAKVTKGERIFKLSLPALVNGVDAKGKEFEERTELLSISSQLANLCLKSKVLIGSKLSLIVNIPRTLILEHRFNLHTSGEVIYIKADGNRKKRQIISIHLDKNYKLLKSSYS